MNELDDLGIPIFNKDGDNYYFTRAELLQIIQERERLAVYDFHNYIMGKNIIQTETDQAFNYARLHKAIDEYIADLSKQAVKVKGVTK